MPTMRHAAEWLIKLERHSCGSMVGGLQVASRPRIDVYGFDALLQGFGDQKMVDAKSVVVFKAFHAVIPP